MELKPGDHLGNITVAREEQHLRERAKKARNWEGILQE